MCHNPSRSVRFLAATILSVALLIVGSAGPLSATSGVSRERIRVEFEGANDFVSSQCGIAVEEEVKLDIHVLEFADGRSKVHINRWLNLSSPAGEIAMILTAMIQFDPTEMVDNGDGTSTLSIPHREMVSAVHLVDGANITDAGVVTWDLQIVIDNASGEVVNEHEVVTNLTGHFPIFQSDGLLPLVCEALTGSI